MWCSLDEAVKRAKLPISVDYCHGEGSHFTVGTRAIPGKWIVHAHYEPHEATRAYTQLRYRLLSEEMNDGVTR